MKTSVHLWYIAEFFLEWEMIQRNVAQKIKIHTSRSIIFFRNSYRLREMGEKCDTAGEVTDDNKIWQMPLCVLHI